MEVTTMTEPQLGPTFRVYCEACDVEQTINSRVLAEDLVEAHETDANCPHAEFEEVETDG